MLKPTSKADRLFRNSLIGSLGVGLIVGLGMGSGIIPEVENWTPMGAIAVVAVISVLLIGSTFWFLKLTDEHDRQAHLWGMTWAWLVLVLGIPAWGIFERIGLTPPTDATMLLIASSVIGAGVWAWMRYR